MKYVLGQQVKHMMSASEIQDRSVEEVVESNGCPRVNASIRGSCIEVESCCLPEPLSGLPLLRAGPDLGAGLLLCLLGREALHEGVVRVVDDEDRGRRHVEHQVVEVDVDPRPVGVGILAEVHPHVGRLEDLGHGLLSQRRVKLAFVAS